MESIMTAQTALITGASSGIGRELAITFAKNGFNVVLIARNKIALDELADIIQKTYSVETCVIAKDLALPGACHEIKDILDQNNIIVDILINNAGFGMCESFVNTPLNTSSEMIAVNIHALTVLTRLLLPSMLQRGSGKVVNIASVLAFIPLPFMATYSASKAYVLSFSKALAEELNGTGVYVIAICPGGTKTNFYERATGIVNKRLQRIPQMTVKDVVSIAFKAIMNNKRVVVTGIQNKMTVLVLPVILKIFGLRLVRYLMDGMNKQESRNENEIN